MPLKSAEAVLQPDSRFATLCVVEHGAMRPMTLADHHAALAGIALPGPAPLEVRSAFDRARNTMIYAFFDYDLCQRRQG